MDYIDNTALGMLEYPEPSYGMGFCVDGTPIPDPSEFSCTESDLDTMGERDQTGYLHRNMVASKWNIKLSWTMLSWHMIMDIGKMTKGPKFQFTFPNPFNGGAIETIEAYAGDRSTDTKWAPKNGTWLGSMGFSVIQY